MRVRTVLLLLFLAFVIGFVVGASLVASLQTPSNTATTPPALAGQAVPSKAFKVDFGLRYDVAIASRGSVAPSVLQSVRILGLTPDADPSARTGSGYYAVPVDRWLVLEHPDGRKTYMPKDSVLWFSEALQ
jgi:hypothetical protein